MTVWRKMKNETLVMDAQAQRERDEMNAYIDYLLSDDQTDPPCLTQLVTPHIAECATSG